MNDPFAVLGLPARPDLTGDEVRAAWRRMAAATHPDRADGGDPARYAEAAAAYTTLRTASGRGEAYADLAGGRRGPGGRLRRGRRGVLALRTAAAAAVSAAALAVAGPQPASFALVAGAITWLARTGRRELAPPARPVTRGWFAQPEAGQGVPPGQAALVDDQRQTGERGRPQDRDVVL